MPYGVVNADVLSTSSGQLLGAGNATNFKNRIINGAMVIDQRNAGASVTPTNGAYSLDRWALNLTQASKFTVQQNAGSVTPPTGYTSYLGITSSSAYSVVSTDYFDLLQVIEGFNAADLGFGTANAKTVTLSAWVYSSLTGTFGGSLRNYNANRSYPFNFTISSANTWTQISVTIPGDTTGTWSLGTNTGSLVVIFSLGAGSTLTTTANAWAAGNYIAPTGSTSVVGTNGATFYITGVQLEVGSSATSFEVRDYGRELILCQRYYWQILSAGNQFGFYNGFMANTVLLRGVVNFPVYMRTSPSVTLNNPSDTLIINSSTNVSSITLNNVYLNTGGGTVLTVGSSGSSVQGYGGMLFDLGTAAGAALKFSAEL